MLWIYNNYNINETINFYQVFVNCELVYKNDYDLIYSLNRKKTTNIELGEFKHEIVICDVKMVDNIISYDLKYIDGIEKNTKNVFTYKTDCVEKKNNNITFLHNYKKISVKRMPNLIDNEYNFNSELNFKIYNFEKNIQFVIETNPITNIEKKYFISTDLNLISKYLK